MSGLFGAPPAQNAGGLFGQATTPSPFSFNTPAKPPVPGGLFGVPPQQPATTGLFAPAPTDLNAAQLFTTPTPATGAQTGTGLFGGNGAQPKPVFGGGNIFGGNAPPPSTFGTPALAPPFNMNHAPAQQPGTAGEGVFAQSTTSNPNNPNQSPFGASPFGTAASGQANTAAPAVANPFGNGTPAAPFSAPQQQLPFGSTPATPSLFGAAPFGTTPSPFGAPKPGQAPSAASTASPFALAPPLPAASPFASAPALPTAPSPFGTATAGGLFGPSTLGPASTPSLFNPAPASSPFSVAPATSPFQTNTAMPSFTAPNMQQPAGMFSSTPSTQPFALPSTSGSIFGSGASKGTASTAFAPTDNKKNNKVFCINFMPAYIGKSLQQLRLEDYLAATQGQLRDQPLANFSAYIERCTRGRNAPTWPLPAPGTTNPHNSQPGANLFSNSTAGFPSQANNQAGGLFSSSNAQPGALFPQTNNQPGSLFPAGNTQPSPLFPQTNNQPGGLFSQTGNQTGGLFAQPNNQTGGLFAQPNNQAGGLFSQPNNQAGGLFQQTTNQPGSLFAQANNQPGGSFPQTSVQPTGLFSQTNMQSGSLFPQTPAPASTNIFGPSASQTGGLFSTAPTQNAWSQNPPADKGRPAINGLFGPAPANAFGPTSWQSVPALPGGPPSAPTAPTSLFPSTLATNAPSIFSQIPGTGSSNQQNPTNSRNGFSSLSPPFSFANNQNLPFALYYVPMTHPTVELPTALRSLNVSLPPTESFQPSLVYPPPASSRQSLADIRMPSALVYGFSQRRYSEAQKRARRRLATATQLVTSTTVKPIRATAAERKLTVEIRRANGEPQILEENVSPDSPLSTLLHALVAHRGALTTEEVRRSRFSAGERVLELFDSLSVALSVGGVLVIAIDPPAVAPPRFDGSNFATKPTAERLARMTDGELSRVEGFCVWNEHARLEFLAPVDLRGVDLSQIIRLAEKQVEVYPSSVARPPVGEGLNCPARIVYFGFELPPNDEQLSEARKRVAALAKKMNARLEEIDTQTKTVTISVSHF